MMKPRQMKTSSSLFIAGYLSDENHIRRAQENTHRKILDLGEFFHQDLIKRLNVEHSLKFNSDRNELIEKLSQDKDQAINLYRQKYEAKILLLRKQLKTQYKRLIQEKIEEIERINRNATIEKIELLRLQSKKYLEETVIKLRKEFEVEKIQIRVQTSETERNKIEAKLMEQNKIFDAKYRELNSKWNEKFNTTLAYLQEKFQQEKESSIKTAVEQTKYDETMKLENCIAGYEKKIKSYETKLAVQHAVEFELSSRITRLIDENRLNENKLNETKREFQRFYEAHTGLKKGDAGFLFEKNH